MRWLLVPLATCGLLVGCGGGGDTTTVVVHKTVEQNAPAPATTKPPAPVITEPTTAQPCPISYEGGKAKIAYGPSGLSCTAASSIINQYQAQVDSGDAGGVNLVGQVGSWRCITHPLADYPLLVRCEAGSQRLDLLGTAPSAHLSPPKITAATYRVPASVWRGYPASKQREAASLFLTNNPRDCAEEQGQTTALVGFLHNVWLAGQLPQAQLASEAMLYYCTQLPSGADY